MPRLRHIANVLEQSAGRFQALDAFADDIGEASSGQLALLASPVQGRSDVHAVTIDNTQLYFQVFADRGVLRFSLTPPASSSSAMVGGAAIGGLIGSAVGVASNAKEGLLGGLLLGMLVGAVAGSTAGATPERVVALQFDPASSRWRLYHGPLLRWAKKALRPSETAP